jgi:hypothetical protein
MNLTRYAVPFVTLATLVLLSDAPSVAAKTGCTTKDVEGNYTYTVNGTAIGTGPIAAVGVVSTDGAGNLSGIETDAINGTIIRRTVTGTYTVNANCTGTVTFTDNFNQTTHLDIVIGDDNSEIRFIQTDSGNVVTGFAKRQ